MAEHEFVISKMVKGDIPDVLKLGFNAHDLASDPHEPHFYDQSSLESLVMSPHLLYVARLRSDQRLSGFSITTYNEYTKNADLLVLEVDRNHRGAAKVLFDATRIQLKALGCKRVIAWRVINTSGSGMLTKEGFHMGGSRQMMEYTFPRD